MRILIASVASLAMASSVAVAQPNNGNGNKGNKSNGGGASAKAERGNGGGNRGNGQAKKNRGNGQQTAAPSNRGNRGNGNNAASPRANNSNATQGQRSVRGNGNGNRNAAVSSRGNDRNDGGIIGDIDRAIGGIVGTRYVTAGNNSGYYEGCPPGLAKKRNGCQPPGLAKKNAGQRRYYDRPSLFGLSGLGRDSYFYDDGFLLRLGDSGNVSGYIPLLGGALAIGNQWPDYYQSREVPDYYQSYYNLPPRGYRYADNVIYRVDAETAAIQSVAALLTGDDFVVGQPMPRGYSAYNVPYQYQDRYYDRPDARYRYADGYVYQVDPETQLIAAAIDLAL